MSAILSPQRFRFRFRRDRGGRRHDAIDLLLLLPLLCPAKRAKQQVSVVKPLLALDTGALVLLKRWVFNRHGGR